MTGDELQRIRVKWLSVPVHTQPAEVASALADLERLLSEVHRLQHACDEITRQYARLCQGCAKQGQGLCLIAS